jgi:hypothetical protein
VGFELHDGRLISPSMYCDDLKAAFGGVGVSIQQAVQQAEFACHDIIVPWSRKYGQHWKCKTDKKESKCGYTAIVIDEYGFRSSFDAKLQALTKH